MTTYETIEVYGSEVFYREAGDRSNPTLLLLHGFPSSSAQYEQLIGRLAPRLHVVAPDLPGFGRSRPLSAGSTFDRLAEVIEAFIGAFLTLEATQRQYLDGVEDPSSVNPDLWELDQRCLDLPGRDLVMLDLLYDYQSNVAAYPAWQTYLRSHRPPALLPWGADDGFFPPAGAAAYREDLPGAEIHLLPTGHFATATHSARIAELILAFIATPAFVSGG